MKRRMGESLVEVDLVEKPEWRLEPEEVLLSTVYDSVKITGTYDPHMEEVLPVSIEESEAELIKERLNQLEKLINEKKYKETSIEDMTISQLEFLKETLINHKQDYSHIQELIDKKQEKLSYNNVLKQLFD